MVNDDAAEMVMLLMVGRVMVLHHLESAPERVVARLENAPDERRGPASRHTVYKSVIALRIPSADGFLQVLL